jgi:hypothetical protein
LKVLKVRWRKFQNDDYDDEDVDDDDDDYEKGKEQTR